MHDPPHLTRQNIHLGEYPSARVPEGRVEQAQVWAGQLAWMRNKSYEQNHWCPGVNLLAKHNLDDMAKAAAMGKW